MVLKKENQKLLTVVIFLTPLSSGKRKKFQSASFQPWGPDKGKKEENFSSSFRLWGLGEGKIFQSAGFCLWGPDKGNKKRKIFKVPVSVCEGLAMKNKKAKKLLRAQIVEDLSSWQDNSSSQRAESQ